MKEASFVPVRTQPILVMLVLDRSPSMGEKTSFGGGQVKIDAVKTVIDQFFGRLQSSRIKQNFDISAVAFCEQAEKILDPIPVVQIEKLDLKLETMGRATSIASGLEVAEQIISGYSARSEGVNWRAIVVLITDGEENVDPGRLLDIAGRLKNQGISICCALLPSQGSISNEAKDLMKKVVSSSNLFVDLSEDPNWVNTLRAWLPKSVSSVTGIQL